MSWKYLLAVVDNLHVKRIVTGAEFKTTEEILREVYKKIYREI